MIRARRSAEDVSRQRRRRPIISESGDRSGFRKPETGTVPLVELTDAVAHAVRVAFGALAVLESTVLGQSGPATVAGTERVAPTVAVDAVDLLLGTTWSVARASGKVAASGVRAAAPLGRVLTRPPLLPRRMHPEQGARRIIAGWRRNRPATVRSFDSWSRTAVAGATDAVLSRVDLRQLTRDVLARTDVDGLVADVLDRLDLTRTAELVVDRLDMDRVIGSVLRSVDATATVERVLQDLDLGLIISEALTALDVEAVVRQLLRDLDLDHVAAQVLDDVDADALVNRVVTAIDLEALVASVLGRLDLAPVVAAALSQIDLTQVVLQHVDLIGVAEYVVDGIDLPGIVRDSTGSVASEAVRAMRLQGVEGDDALARAVDRMLHRRRHRQLTAIPAQPQLDSDLIPGETDGGAPQ